VSPGPQPAPGGPRPETADPAADLAEGWRRPLVEHLRTHAVRTGEFTLKSGRRSTWFIDAKQTVCRPEGMALVADGVLSLIPDEATAIGGLTMGADPVAFVTAAVGVLRGRPLKAFSVRKEVKDHGAGGEVAGALDPGDRVVVTEDAVTRGTSLLQAVEAVRRAGAEVVLAVAVVDRGGTADALLGAYGVPFRALVGAPDLGFAFDER
jgi:orotate phosphoribosyltransferase